MTSIDLTHNAIVDISMLFELRKLSTVALGSNDIVDISSVSVLLSLNSLGLEYNQIRDLSPLVDNIGIGLGDDLNVSGNPLACDDEITLGYIETLKGRGVDLDEYGCYHMRF